MNKHYASAASLVLALVLGGCAEQPASAPPEVNPFGEDTVATINGAPLYASVFNAYAVARLQKSTEDLSDDERDALLEEMIQFQLLAGAATDAGLTQEQDIAIDLELQRLQILSRLMATRHLDENPVTSLELQDAYEQNIDQLSGVQYKARHILLDQESEAVAIIAELDGGADFAQLAMDRSTGPSGPNGGDLGWFSADTMVEPFANAVSAMEVGTFSQQPVQTRFGWHVILLEDMEDRRPPGLEAVRADITSLVEQQKVEAFLNSLRETAEIITDGDTGQESAP